MLVVKRTCFAKGEDNKGVYRRDCTSIINKETGEMLHGVQKVEISVDVDGNDILVLTISDHFEFDMEFDKTVVKIDNKNEGEA